VADWKEATKQLVDHHNVDGAAAVDIDGKSLPDILDGGGERIHLLSDAEIIHFEGQLIHLKSLRRELWLRRKLFPTDGSIALWSYYDPDTEWSFVGAIRYA